MARLAAVSLLLAAILPSLLSTDFGLRAGTKLASHFTEGDIKIDKAELGWLKPIHLHGVAYKLPAALGGEPLASAETLGTKSRLWDVIVGRRYDVYGTKPWLDCSFASSGTWKWTELSNYVAGKQVARPNVEGSEKSSLVADTTEIQFSAEARLLTASVYLPDGVMKVPQEVKEVIGKHLHLTAVLGRSCMKTASDELDLDQDLSWADQAGPSARTPSRDSVLDSSAQTATSLQELADRASHNRELSLEPEERKTATSGSNWLWESHDPGVVFIQSENLKVAANGWRRRSDGAYQLNEPGRLEFQYTPALAQYVLGRLSPLLSGVLGVEDGVVGVDVTPKDLISPAETYHFRIDPLRIAIHKQGLLKSSIDFLGWKRGGLDKGTLLQGALSAIHVDVSDDGSVETQRLDLLVSPGGSSKGIHLCSWGNIKPTQDRLDLNLGVPADMLSFLGVKGSHKDDVLTIPLTGTFSKPSIDWKGAYSRLSALAASRQGQPKSIKTAILQGIVEDINKRFGQAEDLPVPLKAPLPPEPLPWEQDSSILDDEVKAQS